MIYTTGFCQRRLQPQSPSCQQARERPTTPDRVQITVQTGLFEISYAESHDRVHDVVVVLPERLDGLLAGHVGLGHDQLDVLGLQTTLVHLLAVILLLLLLGLNLGGLALAVVVVVVVVVTGVLALGSLGGGQLLGSGGLGLGVQVLDLGLTEDAVFFFR